MHRKLIALAVVAALTGNALVAGAQERERKVVVSPREELEEFFIAQAPAGAPPSQVEVRGDNVIFLATEMSFSGKLVKGAPYSAQAVTESVQQLSDGNRIVRKNTAQVYRDSEGRTRRDQTLGYIGPYATSGEVPQTVFISDPVAGVHYVLDPSKKTARKMPRMEMRFRSEDVETTKVRRPAAPGAAEKVEIERNYTFNVRVPGQAEPSAPPPPPPPAAAAAGAHVEFFSHHPKADAKTEKLEARSFDGVMAEGTRTTTTIPAGQLGNEQPILIVDERWYSPELQVVVMTRHSDPRSGETTYRLTNIARTEPAATLFQVPADYAVQELPARGPRRMIRRMAPPTAPAPPQEN